MSEVPIISPGGTYLGSEPMLQYDNARIKAVAERIIRGLYFHERKEPVPADYQVWNYLIADREDEEFYQPILRAATSRFKDIRSVGEGLFWYTFASPEEDESVSMWVSAFFNAMVFVGFVLPKASGRNL